MMYHEDDRIRPIPEKYLKMTPEELDLESERIYQEYRKNNPRKENAPAKTSPVLYGFGVK